MITQRIRNIVDEFSKCLFSFSLTTVRISTLQAPISEPEFVTLETSAPLLLRTFDASSS